MKKGIVNALILVFVLIVLVMNVIHMFTIDPALKKMSALVDRICEIVNLDVAGDDTGKQDVDVEVTDLTDVVVTFDNGASTTTTVNFAKDSDGANHLVKVGVTLTLNTAHEDYAAMSVKLDELMGRIDSAIIDTIQQYSYSTYDKAQMQNAVLKTLQEMFNSTFIYAVSFSTFTAQ